MLLTWFFALFAIGCEDEQVPAPPDGDAITRADKIADWFLAAYVSIEKSFSMAERDLQESDQPTEEILSKLQESVSALTTVAESKKQDLDRLFDELKTLQNELEEMSSASATPDERAVFTESINDIKIAIEKKVEPMRDFDFPYLKKFDSELKDSILRWKKMLTALRKAKADTFREMVAGMVATHFKDNMAQAINERRSIWEQY